MILSRPAVNIYGASLLMYKYGGYRIVHMYYYNIFLIPNSLKIILVLSLFVKSSILIYYI